MAKLSAVAVPVHWRLAALEIRHAVAGSGAAIVVVGQQFVGHLEAIEDQLSADILVIGTHDRWASFDRWVDADHAVDPVSSPDPTT